MTLEIKGKKYKVNYQESLNKYQEEINKETKDIKETLKKYKIKEFTLKNKIKIATCEINGIPYAIIGAQNLKDKIIEKINPKINIETQIENILLEESYKTPKTETIINSKNLTIEKADILRIIKTKAKTESAFWVNTTAKQIKGIVLVFDTCYKPIVIHSLNLNKIDDIEFPKESNTSQNEDKLLNDNLINIYLNLIKYKPLTKTQTLLIDNCDKENIPATLKPLYKEIINLYKKTKRRKTQNAYIETALIIFLSGLLTGTLVITIFKLIAI